MTFVSQDLLQMLESHWSEWKHRLSTLPQSAVLVVIDCMRTSQDIVSAES